jgi:hypothetical protein
MVTHYPQRIASPERLTTETDARRADDGFRTKVLNHLRQAFCGIHGHDVLLQFERDRMFLKCVSCGHETPGWAISEARSTITAHDDTRRRALPPRLVDVRRIA